MSAREAFAAAQKLVPDEPTPLMRETPPGDTYPVEALGPLRSTVEAIHDITQAPVAICAQSALGVATLSVQCLADVETLHGRAPVSSFFLTVAQSGERKSACDKLAMKAVREIEAGLSEAYRHEVATHRNKREVWDERRKAILRGAKDEPDGARADLDALGPEPEPPLYPSIVASEPTVEGIVRHLPQLRAGIGLFSDEGGGFIGGHGMTAENRLKTIANLSRFWDGAPIDRWRAGDGVLVHNGRRLSVHLMAQPVAAAGLLSDPVANGQGFLARFLICEPPSAIGSRLRVGHSSGSMEALARFGEEVRRNFDVPLPFREGSENALDLPILGLSPEAKDVLQAFALAVESEQAAGRELEAVRPFASKAAEHAARLAAVLTLFANPTAVSVGGETMASAVSLATFYLNEAARLADAAAISQETAEAEKMRRWLLESWTEAFVSASDAAQRGPFKETKRAKKALKILEHHGWLIPVEDGAVICGKRRREAWL